MLRTYSKQWDDAKEFEKWKNRVTYMDKYFSNAANRHNWKRYISFLWGNVKAAVQLNHGVVNVNEVFAYIKTSVANLYSKNPFITVNPEKNLEIQGAIIKEQLINYRWKQLGLKRHIKKNIAEAELIGHSWVKLGYTAQIAKYESDKEDEVNEYVKGEDIWATHIPYDSIRFDPEAMDPPYDCRWLYHQYLRPINVVADKYNIDKDLIKPEANYKRGAAGASSTQEQDLYELPDDMDEKTMVYEIYDKDSGRKLLFCDGYDKFLENVEPVDDDCIGAYKIKGFPFVMLKFNDFPVGEGKDNFPMSDIEAWEDQYIEKVKFRSAQINHVKRFNRQILCKQGNLSQQEKEKITQGIDGAIIEVADPTDAGIRPLSYPQLQTDMYAIEGKLDNDRDRISGQSQMDQGGNASTQTRTLGEINQVQQGTGARKTERIDIVEDFCKEIAVKLLQLEKQYTDIEKTTLIVGEIPDSYLKVLAHEGKYDGRSITYTKDDIQGNDDVSIVAGTTMPLDKDSRVQLCVQMAKFGPAFGLQPGSFAALELGKIIIRDLGLKEVELAYEKDIQNLMKAKAQPNVGDQLKQAQQVQNLKKGQSDTNLKDKRSVATDLRNVKQAVENNKLLSGFQKLGNIKGESSLLNGASDELSTMQK